jgi:hypothetical protein
VINRWRRPGIIQEVPRRVPDSSGTHNLGACILHPHTSSVPIRTGNLIQSWYAGVKYRRQDFSFLRNPAPDEVTPVKGIGTIGAGVCCTFQTILMFLRFRQSDVLSVWRRKDIRTPELPHKLQVKFDAQHQITERRIWGHQSHRDWRVLGTMEEVTGNLMGGGHQRGLRGAPSGESRPSFWHNPRVTCGAPACWAPAMYGWLVAIVMVEKEMLPSYSQFVNAVEVAKSVWLIPAQGQYHGTR